MRSPAKATELESIAAPVASDASRSSFWRSWGPLALFSVLWIDLVRQLSYTWETREQYSYGWFVPLFALYLGWRRWVDRPAALHPECPRWGTYAAAVIVLALLPLRIAFEINADWPLLSWIYTLMVVGLTLHALFLKGGWSWVRHFAFPVAFVLVAIAWPYRIEKALTQNLMQVAAGLTVELLGFIGVPGLQRGNLIEISTGVVGVDEACSGIRSFQSTLMASLLMGELYRFRLITRALMVGCGVVLAFVFNIVRTLFLCWEASRHGIPAIDKWHDSAGLTITVACFFALWLLAAFIMKRQGLVALPAAQQGLGSHTDGSARSRKYLALVGCCSLASIAMTEIWYRSHDSREHAGFHWTIDFPTNSPGYRQIELSPRVIGLMRHDSGGAAIWNEDGFEWSAFFFRWNPRSVQAVIHSRVHRPDVCIPATGYRQVGDSSLTMISWKAMRLPFRRYAYEADGRVIHVFFCQWEDAAKEQHGLHSTKQGDRLQSVLSGRRRVGQQTLELILFGYPDLDAAEAAVRKKLDQLIRSDS